MSASITIGGVPYIMDESTYDQLNTVSERQRLKVNVFDYAGTTHFVKGEQVVVTDPVLGVVFTGYIYTDKEIPIYPSSGIIHQLDCIDLHYVTDKRSVTKKYTAPIYAGVIIVEQIALILEGEGLAQNYAYHLDSTQADFSQGNLINTISATSLGNGDVELAKSGTDVIISESTTSDFSSGTLTNVIATNNTLVPATQSAIYLTTSCLINQPTTQLQLYMRIWSGSMVIGSNDTLNYTVWIPDSSTQKIAFVDIVCSDGTYLSLTSNINDQNGVPVTPTTDLTNYAVNKWYTRNISISGLSGKTINSVNIGFAGSAVGPYSAYFKNIYLGSHSGTPFFSTTATATQVSPAQGFQTQGYAASQTSVTIVQAFDPSNSYRVSPSTSINAVNVIKSTLLTASTTTPGKTAFNLYISYDGGTSYFPCTNNAALPVFISGANTSGVSVLLKEVLTSSDSNPTILPTLVSNTVSFFSAPNPSASKSDVTVTYATATNWNAGTHAFTTVIGNSLAPGTLTRNWNDNLITNQSFFSFNSSTQSASTGAYVISTPPVPSGTIGQSFSRFDFAGISADFTVECDVTASSGFNVGPWIVYRTTSWFGGIYTDTYAYIAGYYIIPSGSQTNILVSSNGTSSSPNVIGIGPANTQSANTTYHLKLIVHGSRHQFFIGGSSVIDIINTSFTGPGYVGFRMLTGESTSTSSCTIDNFQITPAYQSTWTSASTSISALGTCGGSTISWVEVNTAVQSTGAVSVASSIDGGTTWQACTNGGQIPGLSAGVSVTGKSVKIQVSFTATSEVVLPSVTNMTWKVLGAYAGSSGTRDTAPMGNDMSISRTVASGWGTAFDSQTWTLAGTATSSVGSSELNIGATTGDAHMRLGTRTWTDEDTTVRFKLPDTTTFAGIELRYTDANNHYRLAVNSTTITITKVQSGVALQFASQAISLNVGTWYRMRFRVAGSNPVNLSGIVWTDGTIEPRDIYGIPLWTIISAE